jgi:methionyl aminopeptidase
MSIVIKRDTEIAVMRQSGRIVAQVLELLRENVRPGVSTAYLDELAEAKVRELGGKPSFKGIYGNPTRHIPPFPASVCTSTNNEVVHGIPKKEHILKEGDIISLDFGAYYKGYHADAALTLPVGQINSEASRLLEVTQAALYKGISEIKSGRHLSNYSWAVQSFVEANGFSVVRVYVGHGIGRKLHEEPNIPNFGDPGEGPVLEKGMTLALEPMVNVGGWGTRILEDKWTVVTIDGSLSAHFEHTVVVTDGEAAILTEL